MEPIEVLELAVGKLEEMHIPYMVAGSFASALHGFDRSTRDADLVVAIDKVHVAKFVEAFQKEFYLDRGTIERALNAKSSFNVIHFKSTFKVDFFVLKNEPFEQAAFSRKRLEQIQRGSDFRAYVQTPEDTILSKLIWFKLGGGVSENQWRDVLGILKAQGNRLDLVYLRKWAPEAGVGDLLPRVFEEASQTLGPGS